MNLEIIIEEEKQTKFYILEVAHSDLLAIRQHFPDHYEALQTLEGVTLSEKLLIMASILKMSETIKQEKEKLQ